MDESKENCLTMINGASSPLRLVEFSNANVKLGTGIHLQFQSYKSPDVNALENHKKMLVASTSKLQYVGSNYENEMSKVTSSLLKIGIFNKHTGKIKLFDADYFLLKPILKGRLDIDATDKSWSQKTEDLALTFGSKNRKRMINSRLKYESAADGNILSQIPSQSIENLLESPEADTSHQESEVIPPQNKVAKCVTEIYNIYDIISEEDYNSLESEASMFNNVTREKLQLWKSEAKFSDFIIRCLDMRLQSTSLHVAKILFYLHYMITMVKCNYKDLKKKDPRILLINKEANLNKFQSILLYLTNAGRVKEGDCNNILKESSYPFPGIPTPYKKSLSEKYLVNRAMPQRMKDKLLAHSMVLALTVNNYHIDAKLWALSTHIPMTRIVLVAYSLGCHVHDRKSEETKIIELKLPLYKYEPRGKKK